MLERLQPPMHEGRLDVVLDTDTYNEIDDQFALVYAVLACERINLQAVYAAPFDNPRNGGSVELGMERSYEEILRTLGHMGMNDQSVPVLKGARHFLRGAHEPVDSPAARDLVERVMARDPQGPPLYVAAIGAITNVASAVLMEPRIIERLVIVWLAGTPYEWPSAREFNLQQDMHGSKLMFDCGAPLVHVPCTNVAEHVNTTIAELGEYVKGRGAIGDYLFEIFAGYAPKDSKLRFAWSKVIWDITTIAWLINHAWLPSAIVHAPILTDRMTWSHDDNRHFVRVCRGARRDAIFADLFRRLQARDAGGAGGR